MMTTSEKYEVLDELSACYNRISSFSLYTEQWVRDLGFANRIDSQRNRMAIEIDMLLRSLRADWHGDAAELKRELGIIKRMMDEKLSETAVDEEIERHAAEAAVSIDIAIGIAAGLTLSDEDLEYFPGSYSESQLYCS